LRRVQVAWSDDAPQAPREPEYLLVPLPRTFRKRCQDHLLDFSFVKLEARTIASVFSVCFCSLLCSFCTKWAK
ncbi:MAG: hypothetical protein ACYSVY_15930, partial [Planctomycetota bacterium]